MYILYIQGDQKVYVHLTFTVQSSGAQKHFDHPVHLLHINKADTVVHVEDSEESLTNIERLLTESSCEKCLDLETTSRGPKRPKFHTVIELLRNEYKLSMSLEQDGINPTTSQVRLDQEEGDNWKVMSSGCTKGQIRGNIKAK
jgi:hypothetical protein